MSGGTVRMASSASEISAATEGKSPGKAVITSPMALIHFSLFPRLFLPPLRSPQPSPSHSPNHPLPSSPDFSACLLSLLAATPATSETPSTWPCAPLTSALDVNTISTPSSMEIQLFVSIELDRARSTPINQTSRHPSAVSISNEFVLILKTGVK